MWRELRKKGRMKGGGGLFVTLSWHFNKSGSSADDIDDREILSASPIDDDKYKSSRKPPWKGKKYYTPRNNSTQRSVYGFEYMRFFCYNHYSTLHTTITLRSSYRSVLLSILNFHPFIYNGGSNDWNIKHIDNIGWKIHQFDKLKFNLQF